MTRESDVAGDEAAIELDLHHGIDMKAHQLDATIMHLIRDEAALTGRSPVPRRRCVPVLVATQGFPTNPMTHVAIEDRMNGAGLFQDLRIPPLRILDQEELDMIEGVIDEGGAGLLEPLEAHDAGSLRRMVFKDWFFMERHNEPLQSSGSTRLVLTATYGSKR